MVANILRGHKLSIFFIVILLFSCIGIISAKAHSPPPPAVVHVVLFWMEGCPHCHEVQDNILPSLQDNYGDQLQISLIEVSSMEDIERLYAVTARYGISEEHVGVPLLLISEQVLIGSDQILAELPGLIETHMAKGGAAIPEIPEFAECLPEASEANEICTPTAPYNEATLQSVSHVVGILFTTPDCDDCQLIAAQVLDLSRQDYQGRFTVETIDIVTSEDVDYLHQVAAQFDLNPKQVDLPLLILGDQVLMVEEIPEQLPMLISAYLEGGGVARPQIHKRGELVTNPFSAEMLDNGFALAIVVLILMTISLVYSLLCFASGKTIALSAWVDCLIPILIILGIGVAGYLSFVETQSIAAVCGPVGDCNTVQSSPYARLFGVLPVGVLGLLGYLALLAAWLARRLLPKLEKVAALSFWGMAVIAVLFSIYLTYLEPFVIKAVCAWCLASAVIMMLLLLIGTQSAVQQFITTGEEEV